MRDDSSLYTGLTSVAQEKLAERNKERQSVKRDTRARLLPAGEIVAAQFRKEVEKLMYAPYEGEDSMSDEQFRTERRARRIAVESLLAIQTRLNNLLREDGRKDA